MGVSDENVMNVLQRYVLLFQNGQDAIAAAGVHQQVFGAAAEGKAGIIAAGDGGISRTQYDQFFHVHVLSRFQFFRFQFFSGRRSPAALCLYYTQSGKERPEK